MSHNGVGKPTINGIVKGRPGKGKVLSLGQRKTCYAGHSMTKDNIFAYHERIWCRRCRADSRNRSHGKRLAEAKAMAKAQRKTAVDNLNAAFAGKPKAVKAVAPKTAVARRKPKATETEKARVEKHLDRVLTPEAKAIRPASARVGRKVAKAVGGNIACGECDKVFPDPPSASKHFNKAHGGTRKVA